MISIIIRSLDDSRFLYWSLLSIFRQHTDDGAEILVFDGRADDEIEDICREFQGRDISLKHFKLVDDFHRAYYFGAVAATGDKFLFQDEHITHTGLGNLDKLSKVEPGEGYVPFVRPWHCSVDGIHDGSKVDPLSLGESLGFICAYDAKDVLTDSRPLSFCPVRFHHLPSVPAGLVTINEHSAVAYTGKRPAN